MKVGEVGMKEAIIQYNDIPSGGYMAISWKPLVRCSDCKYGNLWSDLNVIVCDKLSKTRDKNWFCADGEKAVK